MRSLVSEIMEQPWFEKVPADLSTAVSDAFSRMQRAAVEIELKKMVEPLREAFAAQSFQECQALVQRWKNVMAASSVTTISPELTDEIRPVIAYVQEQEKRAEYLKKFRDSCRAFIRMLDADAPAAQLEMGYARLKEFNEPIPADVTERYEAKEEVRERAISRKHRARLMGIGASAAGLAVIVLVAFVMITRASEAKQWAEKIESTLGPASSKNLENLKLAQQYVDELRKNHPSFLSEGPLAAAVRDVSARQGDYDRDTSTVQSLLGKFDAAQKTADVSVANKSASLDQLMNAAGSIHDVLSQSQTAGDLSWADTPDKKFTTETAKLQETFAALQTRAAAIIRPELTATTARFDAIGPSPANMSEASDQLDTMGIRLRALAALPSLDDTSKGIAASLFRKVDQAAASRSMPPAPWQANWTTSARMRPPRMTLAKPSRVMCSVSRMMPASLISPTPSPAFRWRRMWRRGAT